MITSTPETALDPVMRPSLIENIADQMAFLLLLEHAGDQWMKPGELDVEAAVAQAEAALPSSSRSPSRTTGTGTTLQLVQ